MALSYDERGQFTLAADFKPLIPLLEKIMKQESVTKTQWQQLICTMKKICWWDEEFEWAEKIAGYLHNIIDSYATEAKNRILTNSDDMAFLNSYLTEWQKFLTQCSYFPIPFKNMDKEEFVIIDDYSVRNEMLATWKESAFAEIQLRLLAGVMKVVESERNGHSYDPGLVIAVRDSIVNLKSDGNDELSLLYRDKFEKPYMESLESFYAIKVSEYLDTHTVLQYIKFAEQKIVEETERGKRYLLAESKETLAKHCNSAMILSCTERILSECPAIIKESKIEDVRAVYSLVKRVPQHLVPIDAILEDHIVSTCLAELTADASTVVDNSEKYVEKLTALFTRFAEFVKEAFSNDFVFLKARDDAFRRVVNDISVFRLDLPLCKKKGLRKKTAPESKCPEMLADYCDSLLRKTATSKKFRSDEIDKNLEAVAFILKFVQNNDVFMQYYKSYLTRRLILETSKELEKEESALVLLKDTGMPVDFFIHMSRMFKDIKISEDFNKQFKAQDHKFGEMNVKILTAGSWSRVSNSSSVSLPIELEAFLPAVETFYHQKHAGKKLQWLYGMSSGVVVFRNLVGKFDLNVTTFQIIVLLVWNRSSEEEISFENLLLATQMSDVELRKTLWSLMAAPKLKSQVVTCKSEVKSPSEFTDSTKFSINDEFAVIRNGKKQNRGKLNFVGQLQLSTENSCQEDKDSIVRLRVLRIQEAIVKIMKARQTATFGQIHAELIHILKNFFFPSKSMIKEQIEWLEENEYLRRDENDQNKFRYVA